MKTLNLPIEGLRFFFICIICLWHCKDFAPYLTHGYLAVEFYFILSGFFIYQSYVKHPETGVFEFTLRKIQRFLVPFLLCWLSLIILDRKQYLYLYDFTPDEIIQTYFLHFHDIFFCQGLGLTTTPGINHPLWFISILLFGGAILYSLLRNFRGVATSLLIPTICLFGFNFLLLDGNNSLLGHDMFGIHARLIRGLSEMGLGIMVAVVDSHIQTSIKKHSKLTLMGGAIGLMGICLLMIVEKNYDYLAIFFIPLIIFACLHRTIEESPISTFVLELGELSLYMYFIHLLVITLFYIFVKSQFPSVDFSYFAIPYIVCIVIASYLLKLVSNQIWKICNTHQ